MQSFRIAPTSHSLDACLHRDKSLLLSLLCVYIYIYLHVGKNILHEQDLVPNSLWATHRQPLRGVLRQSFLSKQLRMLTAKWFALA